MAITSHRTTDSDFEVPTSDRSVSDENGSELVRFEVGLIGRIAYDILSEGFTGHVIASGSSALYLRGDDRDEIIGVGRKNQPAHTRFLLASAEPSRVPKGVKARSDGERLSFDDGTIIELSEATVWHGRGPDCFEAVPADHVDVGAALQAVMSLHSGQNLGVALKRIYGQGHAHEYVNSPAGYEDIFLQAATNIIRTLVNSFSSGPPGLDIGACRSLVGLGPGLTPSGDDFLGGLLFAVWHLNAAYPSIISSDAESIGSLLGYASSQTNQISYAILTDFAVGQGPLPLHDLVEALLTGKPRSAISDCIRQVAAIGHSSGWDMLAGFTVGMTMIDETSIAQENVRLS